MGESILHGSIYRKFLQESNAESEKKEAQEEEVIAQVCPEGPGSSATNKCNLCGAPMCKGSETALGQ